MRTLRRFEEYLAEGIVRKEMQPQLKKLLGELP